VVKSIPENQSSVPERTRRILWIVFGIWSAIGAAVMASGGLGAIGSIAEGDRFFGILDAFDRHADAIWMFLAGAVLFVELAKCWGARSTLIHFVVIGIITGALETIGVLTGFPFGDYEYTNRYGFRLAGILPFAIPVAWFVVVGAGLAITERLSRGRKGPVAKAGVVAVLAVLTDINLEPVAWKVRGYWHWYTGSEWADKANQIPSYPPIENYISWAVIAFGLALVCAFLPRSQANHSLRPFYVLLILNTVLVAAHLGRLWA